MELTTTGINYNDAAQLAEIRKLIAKDLTDHEFGLFINLAKSTGLNPFKSEIWAVKAGQRVLIMIGINGYLKFADSHPEYDGYEISFEENPTNSKLPKSCTAKVYRKDRSRPTVAMVRYDEYQRKSDSGRDRWSGAPFDMLEKCALSKALRRTFNEIRDTYEDSEITIDSNGNVEPIEQKESKQEKENRFFQENLPAPEYLYDISSLDEDQKQKAVQYLLVKGAESQGMNMWVSKENLPKLIKHLVTPEAEDKKDNSVEIGDLNI